MKKYYFKFASTFSINANLFQCGDKFRFVSILKIYLHKQLVSHFKMNKHLLKYNIYCACEDNYKTEMKLLLKNDIFDNTISFLAFAIKSKKLKMLKFVYSKYYFKNKFNNTERVILIETSILTNKLSIIKFVYEVIFNKQIEYENNENITKYIDTSIRS
jgi:hypothetical protein